MSSDYKDKRPFRSSGVLDSFKHALTGIFSAILHERNIQIHLVISFVVVVLGLFFRITPIEWILISFAIGGVISLELVNTAIERVVDLVTEEYHPLAKQAKDIAAGAVLIYALLSVIVGFIIFFPKLINMFLL
ncbi:diacylglycerol kinase family protein (plasmid) [Bacillus sp. 31A1R]|uniref:Diacylglycerol kinase family protein n=1 Tax=Robertmurraya mangrovi TaxID=3098077 RepID=A0ABU5IUW9_9BACI|nr:diacylglycerol kinase family protein [Bacillus sp. 31A1R]MDZ5470947.1 diacylglycerol kinase family protein [Bacillus sp. 31A1R]